MQLSWTTTELLQGYITDLVNKNHKEIHLLISSVGGDVDPSVALFNFLMGLDISLHTYNLGNVDSAGILIFLAGAHRSAGKYSTFLFHNVHWGVASGGSWQARDFDENRANLNFGEDRLKAIYVDRMGISSERAAKLINGENRVWAPEAMKMGLIDSIAPLKIPFESSIYLVPTPK